MKNLFTFAFTASFMVGGITASAQTQYTILNDLTSKLTNADFTADSPLSGIEKLATYDYDMPDAGAGAGATGKFGLQAITGWTANIPSDNIKVMENNKSEARPDNANAKAAGIFAYNDDSSEKMGVGLGGSYYAPYLSDGKTQGVGLVAVWGAEAYYTQDVTLPAGAYMLVATVQNTSGTQAFDNRLGFVVSDTEKYYSTKTAFDANTEWKTDTAFILINEDKTVKVSFGYKSTGAGSAANQHLYYDNIKLYEIDKTPLIKDQIDALKKDLLAVMETAEFNGVNIKAAKAIYDDDNATLEQVQNAIDDLKAKIKEAQVDLSASFLQNPHFDSDTPVEVGICTYAKDKEANGTQYSGMQPVSSWVSSDPDKDGPASGVFAVGSKAFLGGKEFLAPDNLSDGSTEGRVLGLVACWTSTTAYTQGVTMPAGNYTLTFSYYNAGGTQAIDKNLFGFKAGDTEYYGTSTTFPVGKWASETVTFTLDEETEGVFSLGYKSANVGSGTMPHLFVDGVTLYYAGAMDVDPSLFALQAAVSSAKKYQDISDSYYTELGTKLDELVEKGDKLVSDNSDDAEANTAAANEINNLIPEIQKNITAYENLVAFQDGALADALAKYESVTDLYETLQGINDDVEEAKNDKIWGTEKINETIASLSATIKAGVQKAFDDAVAGGDVPEGGLSISELYDQLGYTYSTTAVSNTNVPDKEWSYGDASNFKTQYGTAEVWNQSPFTVSRTLKDMPAGTYTITAKGIYRNADSQANADNYDPSKTPEASVFAGHAKTGLTNIATLTLTSDEAIDGWLNINDAYMPNSQKAAYDLFTDADYTAAIDKSGLAKSVSTVLTEAGDLTFGVKADKMDANSWVVWYSFDIKYSPIDADVLSNELAEAVKGAKAYYNENAEDNMNTYGATEAEKAIEKAENAIGKDAETMAAAIKSVDATIAAMKANVEAKAACENAYTALGEAAEAEDAQQTTAAINAYNEANAKYESLAEMTTEELVSLTAELQHAAALFRIPDYNGASDQNPVDMTCAIVNPSFENEEDGLKGWTYYKGQDTQAADNSNATYTTEGVDGNKIFNTWSSDANMPEGGLYVSQVLKALPAGTYQLTALVASDIDKTVGISAGSTAEGAQEYGFAKVITNEKNVGEDISAIFTVKEGEDITIKVSAHNWFKADNFRLTYFGSNSQKETTGIEGTADQAGDEIVSIVTAAGAKVNALVKGVNIVTYKNGVTKKVILK